MEQLRQNLAQLFASTPYSPRAVLESLSEVPELGREFAMPNSGKHGYPLIEHTFMVCNMFERAFPEWPLEAAFPKSAFRLLLCLHDMGKPAALRMNDKAKQHVLTVELVRKYQSVLPVSHEALATTLGLLSDDALGLFVRNKIPEEEAVERVGRMYARSEGVDADQFFGVLTAYYQVDSGSYTKYAFALSEPFVPKPKLEAVFRWNAEGEPVYDPSRCRLQFSEPTEFRYEHLKSAWLARSAHGLCQG
ncbi:hypothetical protein FE633_35085 [Streptomyces montanus]|uniref:HD domain-containing protein n=1 Tax=Streptomyces montanus TaxID=2580423 RepID=A0A5R9FM97_9ACTN|nr:hypothetical protein [Streptomyces montanus]TLS41654.1 hypothetical protein FE633_35085 [Streptomyces montanus]